MKHNLPRGNALLKRASERCGLALLELRSQRRHREVAAVRQVLMMLLTDQGFSLMQVARMLGRQDHTTVMHGARNARAKIEARVNPWFEAYQEIITP